MLGLDERVRLSAGSLAALARQKCMLRVAVIGYSAAIAQVNLVIGRGWRFVILINAARCK